MSTMRTWLVVSYDGDSEYVSAYTETEAREKAWDLFGGNVLSFEEA